MKMKRIAGATGILSLAGAALIIGGCQSNELQQAQQMANKPLYRVFEKSNKIEASEKAECIRLFDHNVDGIDMKTSMAQIHLKPGAELKQRVATSAEIFYVISGAGMIKINGIAYVLRENSGIYIPAGGHIMLLNNGSKPLKCLLVSKSLSWMDGKSMPQPLTFDKNAPKTGESKTYDEIVGTQPQWLQPQPLETTTLSPKEEKVKTLNQDWNQ